MFPHNHPFDPTYGYTLDTNLKVPAPEGPPDFEDFWRRTYEEARATPLNLVARPIKSPREELKAFEVEFDALGGARIGGWFFKPAQGRAQQGLVVGHGYGHREGPDWTLPVKNVAAIFPCARGLGRSRTPKFTFEVATHVVHGLESRETYMHRGCAADLWAACSALLELVPGLNPVDYLGMSFGGGIGALAAPWESRFRRVALSVPSFGNHPLRVTLECVGSGAQVRQAWLKNPDVMDVLKYCDSATAARFIKQPMLVECALFDPAVPPPGQFAVYNGIPGEKTLTVLPAAHFDTPANALPYKKAWEEQRDFLRV